MPSPSLLFLLSPPSFPLLQKGNIERGNLTKPIFHEELSLLLQDADSSRNTVHKEFPPSSRADSISKANGKSLLLRSQAARVH